MFLIYVNDIPNIITSTAKLFADDIKIYRQVGECHQITEGLFRKYVLLGDSYIEARSDRFINDSLFNKYNWKLLFCC